MTLARTPDGPFHALIVGAGVAALEATLALKHLAGDQVQTTLLAPNTEFVYRPMGVAEPFSGAPAPRFPLAPILAAAGARQQVGSLEWVDHDSHLVHDDAGGVLHYDALLLAIGARVWDRYPRALTIDPRRLDDQLHEVVRDIESGAVKTIAFIVPEGRFWPLPVYELALMTAARANEVGQEPHIVIVTPERSPLAIFGDKASDAVAKLIAEAGIELIPSAVALSRVPGRINLRGRVDEITVDSIVALPQLLGPDVAGIPATAHLGFVATDPHGRVRHLDRVFAAGDMTDYPVKQGAIAAQQALCVAQEIAGLAGVATVAEPFEPIIHGVLLGPDRPLYLRARLIHGVPSTSEVSESPLWASADKIRAPYLTRALFPYGTADPSMASAAGGHAR